MLVLRFAGAAAPSGAQSPPPEREGPPGVDPDSPTGVEYQLPLQRTRRETAGLPPPKPGGEDERGTTQSPPAGADTPVPLFGVGLGGGEGAGAGNGDSPGLRTRSPGTRHEAPEGDDPVEDLGPPRAAAVGNGASSTVPTLGVAGGIIALAALVGLTVRRRLRRS